jgi:hypothetical protein
LLVEALIIEHAGVVELLVQLNVGVLAGVVNAQAGQQLLIEVGLEVGELGALQGRYLREHPLLRVVLLRIEGIEKLQEFQALGGALAIGKKPKMALFGLR